MANTAPVIFRQICQVRGDDQASIDEQWWNLCRGAYSDFFTWLITEAGLTEEQLKSLTETLSKEPGSNSPANPLSAISSLLTPEHQTMAAEKYATIVVEALDKGIVAVRATMSPEQNQVVRALLEAKK